MKRLFVCSLIIGALLFHGSCGKRDVDRTGLVKLSGKVYAMIATGPTAVEGLGANSGFVVGKKGVLVVDARYTGALANDLLRAIRSVTDAPIAYVVNTHYHPDHTWGNMVFKDQGAVIVSRPETREALLKYSPVYLEFYKARNEETYAMLGDVRIVAPDTVFGDEMDIDLGGVKVAIRFFGPSHTAGDAVVVVPKERVAFAGGILSNGYHPNMGDPGADFDNWVKTLGRLESLRVRYFVPGQGRVCGKEAVRAEKTYIETLRRECVAAIEKQKPIDQTAAAIVVPGTEEYLQPNIFPFNVQAVYRAEVPRVVKPPFTIDTPEEFEIQDGGGGPKAGMIRWGARNDLGYLEIEVRWNPTVRTEIIAQDIAEQVSRAVASGERRLGIEGTKRIDVGGEEAVTAYGPWQLKPEFGSLGGGRWEWAQVVSDGTLYSIQLATDAGNKPENDEKNMLFLESIARSFAVKRR